MTAYDLHSSYDPCTGSVAQRCALDTSSRRWDLMVSWPHGAWGWGLLYLGNGLFAFVYILPW